MLCRLFHNLRTHPLHNQSYYVSAHWLGYKTSRDTVPPNLILQAYNNPLDLEKTVENIKHRAGSKAVRDYSEGKHAGEYQWTEKLKGLPITSTIEDVLAYQDETKPKIIYDPYGLRRMQQE